MAEQSSTLRVGVDSTKMVAGAKKGEAALAGLGQRAEATEGQFSRLTRSLGGFKSVMAGLGIALVAKQFANLLDSTTNIDNRLRLVTNTTAQLNAVYKALYDVSNQTRSSVTANVELFNKLGIATQQLGLSYQKQINFVKQFNEAAQISGASTDEVAMATLQLSQGLALGVVRGQDLKSVLSFVPKAAQVIADHFHVARGEILNLGAAGKITSKDVVDAFAEASTSLDEEFTKIAPTIGGSFQVLQNHLLDFIRNINKAGSVGEVISRVILFIADHFKALAGAVAGVAVVIAGQLMKSFATMAVAMATNPIGLLIVALGTALALLGQFGDAQVKIGNSTVSIWGVIKAAVATAADVFNGVKDVGVKAFSGMSHVGQSFFQDFVNWLSSWGVNWSTVLGNITGFIKTAINGWIGIHIGFVKSIGPAITKGLPALFQIAMGMAKNLVIDGIQGIIDVVVKGLGGLGDLLDKIPGISGIGDKIRKSMTPDLSGLKSDTSAAVKIFQDTGAQISGTMRDAMSTDYVGTFVSDISKGAQKIGADFQSNVDAVAAGQKKAASANDILSQSFGTATDTTNTNTAALAKLNAERQKYIQGIDKAFAKLQSAHGNETKVVKDWYEQQKAVLQKLGLDHTAYADKVAAIFKDKLKKAYEDDLKNATDWKSGMKSATADMAKSMGTMADLAGTALTDAVNGAAQAIVDFAKTGKFNFRKFAESVASDVLMMITKMILLKAIETALGMSTGGGPVGGTGGGIPGKATGGMITGPGTGTSDSIPTMLSHGEFIINAKSTKQFLPLLKAINEGQIKKHAKGGLASAGSSLSVPQSVSNPAQPSSQQGHTVVTTPPPTVNVHITPKDITDALSGAEGDAFLVRGIRKNSKAVRSVLGQ